MSWKRTFLLFLACVVALTITTWFVLRRAGVAKTFVQRLLAERIEAPFALHDAVLDLGRGTLQMTDLRIAHPVDSGRDLLQAQDIHVSLGTNPLGGVGRIEKVVLRGVRIHDLQVAGSRALQLDDIFKVQSGSGDATTYPAVVLEDAEIGVLFADDGTPLRFADVDLELLPLEGSSSEVVLRGTMTTHLGTRVSLSGQGDLGKRRFRVLARTEGLSVEPSAVAPFSAEIAEALQAAELSGHVAQAQLWLETDDAGALRGGFQVDADVVSFRAQQFPRRVQGRATVRGLLQDEGSVSLAFESDGERGTIGLRGNVLRLLTDAPEAHLALDVAALRVDEELLRALQAQPLAARVVAPFSPRPAGTVDADARVFVRRDGVEVEVAAKLQGLSAGSIGFYADGHELSVPYPVHDVGGSIRFRDDVLELDALEAADEHGGRVRVRGKLPCASRAPAGDLTVTGEQIEFGSAARGVLAAISDYAAACYDECAPEGRADVALHLTGIAAGSRPDFRLQIRPLDAAVTHAVFPYRCDRVNGTVDIDREGVVFDLRGARSGKAVAAHGRFTRSSSEAHEGTLRSELWLQAEELTVDDDLRSALDALTPASAELWPSLAPSGKVACEVTTWRTATDPDLHYDVRLDVLAGRVCPPAFPLAVEELNGPVFVHGDGTRSRVDVHLLRGRVVQDVAHGPAEVFVSGGVRRGDDAMQIDLTTVARGLVLRPELRDVLDRAGALSAAAWDAMHPSGRVDVIARHQVAEAGSEATNHVRLQLDGVGVQTDWLPAPVTGLTGEIVAVGGKATAAELRGLIGNAPLIVRQSEVWHTGTASRLRATVSAEDVPLDDDIARLFGDSPLRAAYLQRKVRGRAHVTSLELDCTVPDEPQGGRMAFSLDARGQMTLRDCSFSMAVPVEHVDGILSVHECSVAADSGRMTGSLANLSLHVLGRPVHDLSASFTADADEIVLSDLSARLHGGRVTGEPGPPHLRYRTEGDGVLSANLAWQGLRLSELVDPTSRSPGGVSGNLAGSLVVDSLPGTRLIDLVGRGSVRVSGGRLGDVPIFRSIYGILRRQPQFTSAEATFRVEDRHIQVDALTLGSQILEVNAKGQVTMDGYVDMTIELPDLFGDAADFLILPEILHNAVAQVLEFKLHGYLRSSEITPRTPFQSTPARRELGPIPAPLPELPRRRF